MSQEERSQLRFAPPEEEYRHVERVDVEEDCPECDSDAVKQYPTLRFNGWQRITRCQDCFNVLQKEEMLPYGFWQPWTWDWKK